MGVIIYSFNLNISPKVSYDVFECDIVELQNYAYYFVIKYFIIKRGIFVSFPVYLWSFLYEEEPPQIRIYSKNIYSYMFKLQSPSNYSPFDVIRLLRRFFHCSKQFLNSLILMPLVLLPFFVLPLPYQQNISLWGLFSSWETNKQKCHLGQDRVNRKGEELGGGVKLFLVKICWTFSAVWCSCKSPIIKWTNTLKESSNKIHWGQMQPLTTPPVGTLLQMGA